MLTNCDVCSRKRLHVCHLSTFIRHPLRTMYYCSPDLLASLPLHALRPRVEHAPSGMSHPRSAVPNHNVNFDYSVQQSDSERRKPSGILRWRAISILHFSQSCHRCHTIAGSRRFSYRILVDTHEGVVLQLLRNLSSNVMNIYEAVEHGSPAGDFTSVCQAGLLLRLSKGVHHPIREQITNNFDLRAIVLNQSWFSCSTQGHTRFWGFSESPYPSLGGVSGC